jgi:hypothetical protein
MSSFELDSDVKSVGSDIVFQHPIPNQNPPGPSSPKRLSYQHQKKKQSASVEGNGLESVPEEPAQALRRDSRSSNKIFRNEESTNEGIHVSLPPMVGDYVNN